VGKKYSYLENFLGRHCYFPEGHLKLDYEAEFSDGQEVPSTFSFLTYNIWGLDRTPELRHLFDLRAPLLEKTIRATGADLLCLQEMSAYSYERLAGLISSYTFASEIPYRGGSERNRAVDTYFISNYKPSRIALYGLPGVLGYENCMMVVEFPNLVIFNLYNQAGSQYSPGQKHKAIHYSRCRYDILQTIYDLIIKKYSQKSSILCGDFNFDLDGSVEDWPEMEMIHALKTLGFIDTFRLLRPSDPGFTEDTKTNLMRWNQKLIEKQYRYDGVFYRIAPSPRRGWALKESNLIGQESACLTTADSAWFIDKMSEAKGGHEAELRGCEHEEGTIRVPILASDHFGVLTNFKIPSAGGTRRIKAKRKNKTRHRNAAWKEESTKRCVLSSGT